MKKTEIKGTSVMYTDDLGKELRIKFSLGGFNGDITCCALYQSKQLPIFFNWFVKERWVKVYSGITTADIDQVRNWADMDYHSFALRIIEKYNSEIVAKEIINRMTQKLNRI
jgi:hypothetical protein